jgi:hypothetical protein
MLLILTRRFLHKFDDIDFPIHILVIPANCPKLIKKMTARSRRVFLLAVRPPLAESRAEKLPLHFLYLRAPIRSFERKGNFSARQCRLAARRRGGANWIFSEIFAKIGSSLVVKILRRWQVGKTLTHGFDSPPAGGQASQALTSAG